MDILQNTNMDCSTVEAVALDRQTQPGQEITISSISEGISATRNTDSSKTQSMELDGDLNTQPDDPKDIALPDHKQAQKEANLAPPSALFPPLARSGTDTTANPRQPTPDEARRKTLNRRFPIYLPPLEIPASISHVTAASPILPTSHRTRPREDSLSSVGFGYRDTLLDFFQYDSDAAEASSPESSLYSGVMHEDDIDYVRPDSPTDSAYLNERTGVDDATGKGSRISSSLQEGENDCGGTTAVASGGWNRSQNSVESEIGGDSIENGTEFDSPPAIPHKSPLRNLKAYTLIAEASHRHQRETPAKDVVFEEQIRTDSNPPAIPLKSPLRDARLYARIAEASRRRHELNKSNNPRNHDISETMSQLHGSSTTQTSKVLPTSPVRATTSGSDNSVSPLACTLRERRRGGGNNDHMDAYNSFSRSRSPSSTKQKQFNRSQASADMKKLIPWTSVSPWASVGCAVGGDLLHAAYTTIPLRGGGPGYEHADSPATSTSFARSPNTIEDERYQSHRVAKYTTTLRRSQFLDPEVASAAPSGRRSIFSFGGWSSTFPASISAVGRDRTPPRTPKKPINTSKELFYERVRQAKREDDVIRKGILADRGLTQWQKDEKIREREFLLNEEYRKARRMYGYPEDEDDDDTVVRIAQAEGSASEPSKPSTAPQQTPSSSQPKPSTEYPRPLAPSPSKAFSIPREERWIPATLSKAGKVIWKSVKVILAVPTDEELKSYSRTHPPPGHVPVHIPLEPGAVVMAPDRAPREEPREEPREREREREREKHWEVRDRRRDGWRDVSAHGDGARPRQAESLVSAGNTTWPRLEKEDYGSQLRAL